MRIAIHDSKTGFHPHWVAYCEQRGIPYKLVNCYSNSIIQDLEGCTALMWHHHHSNAKDILLAKQLLFSLQNSTVKVFPSFDENWHFDDKLGQKYLLERIGAPLPSTHIFYDKESALDFIESATYPIVHKLRHGAGSQNVHLVKSRKQAMRIVHRAFGKGFSNYDRVGNLRERYRKWRSAQTGMTDILKGIARLFKEPYYTNVLGREVGYVYFQEFIPDLDRDYRLKVVEGHCWGLQRHIRKGDFRASGNSEVNHDFETSHLPLILVEKAFQLSDLLGMKSIAFDFLLTADKTIYLTEISTLWAFESTEFSGGFWDRDLHFTSSHFNPFGWMVESMLK